MPIEIKNGRDALDYMIREYPYMQASKKDAQLLKHLRDMWTAVESGDLEAAQLSAERATKTY